MPAKTKARRSKAGKTFLIDFHGRIVGPHLFHLPAKNTLHARVALGKQTSLGNAIASEETMKRMVDNTARIKDLDRMGVDMQVISPSLIHHNTTASDLESAETIVRQVNDHLAEAVATHPDQLAGMGTVPFQDANRSVKELDRLVNRLGFRSVGSLGGNEQREFGDNNFHLFERKAEKLAGPVFIYPAGNQDPRLLEYCLAFTPGQLY